MISKRPLCSIVIPAFDQCDYTRQCLEFLFRYTDSEQFELFLVNNGSSDGTTELFEDYQKRYQQVRNIYFSENRGFSIANNEAARQANGDYLVFLNNDTIPTAGWLSALVDTAQSEEASIVGSKLVYPHTNNINHVGYVYNHDIRLYYPIYHNFWSENAIFNKQREYQALLGAVILVERDIFQQVGGFEDYGLEDVDLCLKVKEHGGRVMYCSRSKVYHYGSVTIDNTNRKFLPVRTSEKFNNRWPHEKRLWDDLKYYKEDGFEVERLTAENITLWRKDNAALQIAVDANGALSRGDFNQALQLLNEACQCDPQCKEVLMLRTKILSENGDLWGVIGSLMDLISLDPLYYEGYIIGAQRLLQLDQCSEACRLLESIPSKEDLPFDIRKKIEVFLEKNS